MVCAQAPCSPHRFRGPYFYGGSLTLSHYLLKSVGSQLGWAQPYSIQCNKSIILAHWPLGS